MIEYKILDVYNVENLGQAFRNVEAFKHRILIFLARCSNPISPSTF